MSLDATVVLDALGEKAPLYAVLDLARDRILHPWMVGTQAPSWCLYRGDLPPALVKAAPHLLRLGRGHAYTNDLFERGWGNAWGILLACDAPSDKLRRHLRKFLRVSTEGGPVMAFRYYDPRVLRVFLPTCTKDELATFFGPIQAFAVEDADPTQFHLYRRTDRGLVHERRPVPAVRPLAG